MKKYLKNNNLRAFLYLLPAMIIIGVFQFYPIFKTLAMGFYTKFDYLTNNVYEVGFDNFIYVLTDSDFILAMRNTCIFVFFSAPLGIIIALIFAVILNSNIHLKKVFCSIYFIPFVTSTVAISIVWSWILNKDYGLLNAFLSIFGLAKISWLTDANMTVPILIVLSIWKGIGYKIIIVLAGLQSIDEQFYFAARMDGANEYNRFLNITIPLLKPSLIFLSVTSIISAFKIFDEVYVMYGQQPGPLKSGMTIVYYIFEKFYRHWEFANASAAAFILFLVILIFTVLQFVLTFHREKRYKE
jgi:multiple sugar transport system permease protein